MKQQPEKGYICTVKLGPKGQIVIPKEVRDMFEVGPGDNLVLMADPRRGIALQKPNFMLKIAQRIMDGKGKDIYPEESEQDLDAFANKIMEEME